MAEIPIKVCDAARQCGFHAVDAMTRGLMSRTAEREKLERRLQLTFPYDWQTLIATMDRFDRASCWKVSPYIMQMWAHGTCHIEETMSLYQRCPAAFRGRSVGDVIGKPSRNILPMLAEQLP